MDGFGIDLVSLPNDQDSSGRTLGTEEIALLEEVIRSGTLTSTKGSMVRRLEEGFAQMLGVKHVLACASGTAAIHCAIAALKLEPGDEIITTPLTDLGSMVPILLQNCVPVFADVLPDTCLIDPADIARKITDRTKGIVVVHLFGHPCDMDPIMEIARAHDLFVVEDCVHALGAEYRGRKVGTIGDFGCFGFNGKHLFGHGAGIVVVNRPEYVERADLFRDLARPRERPVKDRRAPFLGPRYAMSLLVAP